MQLQENKLFNDRYRLIKLLGRGGFSEVWLADDTKAGGMQVALKVYAPGTGLDEDGVQLFSKEFSLVFNLNHSHLLRPSHFDVCDRMPYLIMPFCEKGSAKKLIGRITEKQAWKFLHDVASGLAFLHEQEYPVIHQDIKPENVLINSSGDYLITDFGISSRARSTLRKSAIDDKHTSGGTLAYMAPERFGKDNMPIKASDVWALGATLFELLTGATPFGEHGGLIQKSGAEVPNMNGNWSAELKQIIEKCLSINAWDRPTTADLVIWTENRYRGENIIFDKKNDIPNPTDKINGIGWYASAWKQYGKFTGRARRKEYWMFSLFNFLLMLAIFIVGVAITVITESDDAGATVFLILLIPYLLAVFIPTLAVTVRRLHDTGISGWWLLIGLIPYLGGIVIFIITLLDSQPNTNKYGLNPKNNY